MNATSPSEDSDSSRPEQRLQPDPLASSEAAFQTPISEPEAGAPDDAWLSMLARHHAMSRIELTLETVTECIIHDRPTFISLSRRRGRPLGSQARQRSLNFHEDVSAAYSIAFPGRTAEEAWRFTAVLDLLWIIHDALNNRNIVSKRDIYYTNPALYGSQGVVDGLVDDVAHTFGLSRSALNVTAAAKGLVAGPLTIHGLNGSRCDCSVSGGSLIPMVTHSDVFEVMNAKCILIVEKEAVFRSIISSDELWPQLEHRCIVVTGKGYPDMATRALVARLTACTELPAYMLVDLDPDGVAILSTYKNGSSSLAHEEWRLAVPSLRWAGLHFTDVMSSQELLLLSARDRRKATNMLSWAAFAEGAQASGTVVQYERRELQIMLMLNFKAEIETLYHRPGGLGEWVCGSLDL